MPSRLRTSGLAVALASRGKSTVDFKSNGTAVVGVDVMLRLGFCRVGASVDGDGPTESIGLPLPTSAVGCCTFTVVEPVDKLGACDEGGLELDGKPRGVSAGDVPPTDSVRCWVVDAGPRSGPVG
jgi:hypothetical protein